ncbi:terminase small subunit [Bacillus sp. OxB-1]|uniref:terminase small subunit n=1 Tax=Bacillus sp. (strain OxB-1) TaxID=98228 RepID=UPI0005823296|nr:terminase small subunit [Bacillus sp. OxB-1]BAQ11319.1 terminase small subunit [Bacillus sp. OxB-1]
MPNWEEIQREWETTKITLTALAEKYNVKLGTLKSRKSRDKWSRGAPKKDATKTQKVATPTKRMQPKREQFEPVVESDDLTDKQRLFCIYYIKYFNATKAYQKAYECAYTTAMVEGHRTLRNPKISAEIDRMRTEKLNEKRLSADDILQKYIDIAFADITDFASFGRKEVPVIGMYGPVLDENDEQLMQEVNYVDFKESLEIDGTIITEVKQGKDGVSVKLADKMKALDMLAKFTDLLSDNDKKRLQEEKLKADIAKTEAEVGKITSGKSDTVRVIIEDDVHE